MKKVLTLLICLLTAITFYFLHHYEQYGGVYIYFLMADIAAVGYRRKQKDRDVL